MLKSLLLPQIVNQRIVMRLMLRGNLHEFVLQHGVGALRRERVVFFYKYLFDFQLVLE